MELSEEILNFIKLAGDPSKILDKTFLILLKVAFDSVREDGTGVAASGLLTDTGSDGIFVKQALLGLTSLVLEACKHDVATTTLSTVLEECEFSPERIKDLLGIYEENKEHVRYQLSRITHHFPHIVDVKWRLDYKVKSSSVERGRDLQYVIALQTEKGGQQEETPVTFACSHAELEYIVGNLRAAVSCLEKLSK